eukprot:g2028.t1
MQWAAVSTAFWERDGGLGILRRPSLASWGRHQARKSPGWHGPYVVAAGVACGQKRFSGKCRIRRCATKAEKEVGAEPVFLDKPGNSFNSFRLMPQGTEAAPPSSVKTLALQAMELEVTLLFMEAAVSALCASYPVGCVMAISAAVRHRWQNLPQVERRCLLLTLQQLRYLQASVPALVAAALSVGSAPVLGEGTLTRKQVEAAFGQGVATLLVELQQFVAIERTLRTFESLTPGKVDLAMSLLTAQQAQSRSTESLIVFLANKSAELRVRSFLAPGTGGAHAEEVDARRAELGTAVFAALANLLGLGRTQVVIEDASFAILQPAQRSELRRRLAGPAGEARVTCAVSELQEALQKGNPLRDLSALRVSGRAKSAYSTWKKMEKKKLRFEEILDRLAIRVILDAPSAQRAEELCFEVRDILAKLWSLRPSKQKDYINHPKPNGYRSLHLIAERQGQPFEVQIRTEEMHRQAEYGACGHWEYKAGGSVAMTDAAAGAGAEIFADLDLDGDGRIDKLELQRALRRVEASFVEASDELLEEIREMTASLNEISAVVPKCAARLCFQVEKALAELESRFQAARQVEKEEVGTSLPVTGGHTADILRLSCEQADAVEHPHSLFLQGAVEYVDSLTAYVHRVETGTTRASPTLPTLEDLNVCPACQAASDSDSGAGPISLPEMVFWLEAEMEAREGRQHRRARVMLRGELQRLEENRPLDAGFCQAFCQSHGMMIEPVFEWRKADQVSEVPKRPKVVQTASSCSTESTSGDVPSLVVFMRQHFQERPVEDLRISLSEVQGHAKQLLMHALDARHERLEIFEEATQAARRGLTLADMVLRVQLQNGGREHAPRQLWSPPQMRSTSAWKDVLAVLLQAASGPKRRSPLAKLRKIVLWEQIFSFLVSHAGCLYDQVCLIAERVAEHAAVRHALLQILVASKAGYKWVSAPRHINLSICKEHLEERGRLLSLHAVRPSWKVWQQNWHRRAALVTYVAWMSLAKYGRCECGRKDETFERCRCMQGDGWRHRTHGRWKHLVLGCHALEAFQKLEALEAQHLQHPRLEHLCRELKVDLWRVREADFRWLWRKADEELEAAEQLLKLQLPKIQKHLSYCFEAGRMFLFAGDVEHASEATTEAGTFVKELLETRNVDWHGPVKKDVASIENHFQSPRWAAWCWTFLAMGDQQRIAAPEAWRQAAAAFRDLSDMHRAAVCSMQGHKWQEALTCLTSHSRFQLDTMGGIIAASCASAMLPKAG